MYTTTNQIIGSFQASLINLWYNALSFLPSLFAGFVILFLGYIIASVLGRAARRATELLKVDKFTEEVGLKDEVAGLGIRVNFAKMIGWFVKWFIFLAAIIAAVDVLNIHQLSVYMQQLVVYIPNVLVAIITLAIGLLVGNGARNVVMNALGSVSRTRGIAETLGNIAKWAIFIFSVMAALTQLGIASDLIQIFFTGLVAMVAIAGGIAFGFGGKEHAARILSSMEDEVKSLK